ncbi:MAG: MATE family efflux transporter, partial [Planctomycetota bacterium]
MDATTGATPEVRSPVARSVLHTAAPLIAGSAGTGLMLFGDRVMLGRYSEAAIAAAMPAGIAAFTCLTLFLGIATYAQVFVAQYTGAGRCERSGAAVWQGVHVALFGGLCSALIALCADPLFAWAGHPPAVRAQEAPYFAILTAGGVSLLLQRALAAFWGGRGRTRFVMYQGLAAAGLNLGFNWLLIFGNCAFPRLGIVGAGIGTVLANTLVAGVSFALFLSARNRRRFGTWPARRFQPALLRRLLYYGLPHGLHFFLDMLSFTVFVHLVGRLAQRPAAVGANIQEAASIVFSLNAISFLPLVGLGQATSILVGQAVGADEPCLARRMVAGARNLALAYGALMSLWYLLYPDPLLACFTRAHDPQQAATLGLARRLLYFVCVWQLLDGLWIVYMSAIQGAGDTRFSMWMGVVLAWVAFVVPAALSVWLGADVWALWSILLAYVALGAGVFYIRYRGGQWEGMRVIQ